MTDALPDLIAAKAPTDVTRLPAPLTAIWNYLSAEGPLTLARGEVDALAPIIGRAVATARAHLDPAQRKQRVEAIRVIASLPSAASDDLTGEALVVLYDMAIDDLPLDILQAAVRTAVRDTTPSKMRRNPSFRPSPNELRAYAEPELAARRRRLRRLERMRDDIERRELAKRALTAPGDHTPTPEEVAAIKAEFGLRRTPAEPEPKGYTRPAQGTSIGDAAADVMESVEDGEAKAA